MELDLELSWARKYILCWLWWWEDRAEGPGQWWGQAGWPPSLLLQDCRELQPAVSAGCSQRLQRGAQTTAAWAAVSLQWAAAQGGGVQVSVGPSPIDKLRVRARGGGGGVAQIQGHPPGSVLAWAGTGYWQKLLEVTKYRKLSYNNKQSLYFIPMSIY